MRTQSKTPTHSQGHQGSVLNSSPQKSFQRSSPLSAYSIGKTIGEGNFGKVRIAIHNQTNEQVAIKIIDKQKLAELKDIERVYREIHILKILRHSNVIQLYETIETRKLLLLVMELADGGELFTHIRKNQKLTEIAACRFFQQIINGVEYLHKQMIVHRDLKPENLLLDKFNNIKIVDFGLSNLYSSGEQLRTACGSPCYAAPEMISGMKYNGLKVDLWSCGVILYAMLCGFLPFEDNDTNVLYKKIATADYSIPRHISIEARDLITKILNVDPAKRLSIEEIRSHAWFSIYRSANKGLYSESNPQSLQVDYSIVNEMRRMGYDKQFLIQSLDANRCNAVTTTYYLLMKRNYYLKGNPQTFLREQKTSKTPKQNPRPRTKSPLGDLSVSEALQGLETIIKTEEGLSETKRKHKKSRSFFVCGKPNHQKQMVFAEPIYHLPFVTKLNANAVTQNKAPTPLKIPYLRNFQQKARISNANRKILKDYIDSQLKNNDEILGGNARKPSKMSNTPNRLQARTPARARNFNYHSYLETSTQK